MGLLDDVEKLFTAPDDAPEAAPEPAIPAAAPEMTATSSASVTLSTGEAAEVLIGDLLADGRREYHIIVDGVRQFMVTTIQGLEDVIAAL